MLHVDALNCSYGSREESILDGITFHVGRGSLCGLFGPNGSGKSTLFRCCLKLLTFQEGRVMMKGKSIHKMGIREMAKTVAYVPQDHKPPFPYLVREVVLMGRTPHMNGLFGVTRQEKEKAEEALALLSMEHLADKTYNSLSGGQRQMVLMARAIAQETEIMFLDEPTSALDFSNQIKIWNTIRKIADSGVTILACTHDPNHVSWFCDEVVVLGDRKVVAKGKPEQVITRETLNLIYSDMCDVGRLNGSKIVFPSHLTEGRPKGQLRAM
ncbi:ABC transporter ATP-binding protein [Desulfoluna sp.]|uniref:ABC transporter ATP-binding protein n=1 Tax=Desulfoluna sp. TaxID=2045199 RepID=UPI00262C187D|nr:ABC transporter ATP-binding protein [Desulfoluna sp.]